jgi:hypothetical protein
MLTYPTCLSGMQFKLGVYETFACDDCWAMHLNQLRLHSMMLQIVRAEGVRDTQGSCGFAFDEDLEAWVLDVNGERKAVYQVADVEGLTNIDTSTLVVMAARMAATHQAIRAVYVHKFGAVNPLGKDMIGELRDA